jgi:hypothetical protein
VHRSWGDQGEPSFSSVAAVAGRVIAVVVSSLVALVSLGVVAAGVGMLLADTQAREAGLSHGSAPS